MQAKDDNHILLFFMSVEPGGLGRRHQKARAKDYEMAVQQLFRVIPDPAQWKVIFCENTLKSNSAVVQLLHDWGATDPAVSWLPFNHGPSNKGVGELDMLVTAIDEYASDWEQAASVSYLTGRRLITCPYIFERTQEMTAEVLLGNPDFVFMDGGFVESEKERMYNDMFFSMTPKLIADYADFFRNRREQMIEEGIGSEQALWNFIETSGASVEWLPWMGLMRRAKVRKVPFGPRVYTWHFC